MPANIDNLGITNAAMMAVFNASNAGAIANNTATTYTLKASDAGKYTRFTAAAAVTVTLPSDAAASIPYGSEFTIESAGAGGVTIAAGGGATLHGASGTLAQFAVRHVRKVAANLYTLW